MRFSMKDWWKSAIIGGAVSGVGAFSYSMAADGKFDTSCYIGAAIMCTMVTCQRIVHALQHAGDG